METSGARRSEAARSSSADRVSTRGATSATTTPCAPWSCAKAATSPLASAASASLLRRAADRAGGAEVQGLRRRHIARRRVHLVQHILSAAEAPPHPPAGDAVAGGAELAETSDEEEEAEVPHQQVETDRLLDHERPDSEPDESVATVHLE